jgi:hypothetical protein
MTADLSDWFELDGSETEAQRQFVVAFVSRAMTWEPLGIHPYHFLLQFSGAIVTVAVDIDDKQRKAVARTLRADFDGHGLACGDDETMQLSGGFDRRRPVMERHETAESPQFYASVAADWIEQQLQEHRGRLEASDR